MKMSKEKHYCRVNIYVAFAILIVFSQASVFSQNNDPTELEIKTSGLYYYGQAIGDNEEIAIREARQELLANIIFSSQHKFDNQPQTDLLLQDVSYQYLVFPRGNRIRVIAYLLKKHVIWDAKKEELKIGEAIFSKQTSKLSPAPDVQVGIQDSFPKSPPTEKIESEGSIVNKDDAVLSRSYFYKGEENAVKQDSEQVTESQIATPPTLEMINSESDFILFLQQCNNITQAAPILTEMKVKGRIQFGNEQSMSTPNAYHLLYFDPVTGMLQGFLDKPKSGVRYDFINKTQVQDLSNYKKSKLIWILFF